MGSHAITHQRRVISARKALHAAMATIHNASTQAMAAAPTPERQAAVAEATEYAVAAIKGMNLAIGTDWDHLTARRTP